MGEPRARVFEVFLLRSDDLSAPPPHPPLAAADTLEVPSSFSSDSTVAGSSVADSLDPSTSMDLDLSVFSSPTRRKRSRSHRSGRSRYTSSKHDND